MNPLQRIKKRLGDLDGIRNYAIRIDEPLIRREIEYQILQAQKELKRYETIKRMG